MAHQNMQFEQDSAMVLQAAGTTNTTSGSGSLVVELGEQNSKPVFRTRGEWYCNPVDIHPRCVARLYDISDATAIA